VLVNQGFDQQKHCAFQKLKGMLPEMNGSVARAFEIACSLQKEYVSHCLLHEKWPLTDDIFFNNYILLFMKVFSAIPAGVLNSKNRCLDVGCGEGRMLLLLKAFGLDCYGVTRNIFSGQNLQGCPRGPLLKDMFEQKKIYASSLNIEKEPFPYPDAFFDLVVFQEVIEHLHNSPKLVLDEIKRVLKPNGYMIISTPNLASLAKRWNLLKGRSNHWDLKRYYLYEYVSPPSRDYIGHTREFTLGELAKMLEWAGFSIEKMETFDASPMLRFKDLMDHWVACKGTGLGWLLVCLLHHIFPDLGYYCLISARA